MDRKKATVKLGQLDASSSIMKILSQEKIPFKASYWLRRNIDEIGKVFRPFIEAKQALLKECAVMEDGKFKIASDGTHIKLAEDKEEQFWKEYNELAMKDVEIEIYPLKLEWFDKVEMAAEEIAVIDFMIEE